MARRSLTNKTDPDKAFRNLESDDEYRFLLLDSDVSESLFAKHYLDLELEPYQVFSMRLLRGRFHNQQEIDQFIAENEMEWMFDNGWIKHGGFDGVSPYYWEKPNVLILWPAGFGKGLRLDTPLPTPTGWTPIGDVNIGDELFDENGQICHVTYISEVHHDKTVYAVSGPGLPTIYADDEHLWSVKLDLRKPYKVHDTKWLAERATGRPPIIGTNKALDLPHADLPVDPYVLGVWLGDGDTAGGRITQHEDDQPFIRKQFELAGYKTTNQGDSQRFGTLKLSTDLQEAGVLGNKHIPTQYLRASQEQRLALLQGLIDTDGHVCDKTGVEFCSMSSQLAKGVAELVRSLGHRAKEYTGRATIGGVDKGEKHRVFFYMEDAARMPRKKVLCRDTKTHHHYVRFDEAGRDDTVCIQVDSESSLFLAGEAMLPTHNTTIVSSRVLPVMSICDNPNARLQFIGKGDEDVGSFSRSIRRELESKRLTDDFGIFKSNDRAVPWSDRAFSVAQREWRDMRENFEFYGTNSHLELGKRSDQVYIDDVETPDTANTPDMRNKLMTWMRQGPLTSARPLWARDMRGRVLVPQGIKWSNKTRYWGTGVVGTIFNPEAFYATLMKDPTFTCVKFDCYKDKKCKVSLSDMMLPAEDLDRERLSIGVLAFNKRFRNIAFNEEEMAFREAWVRGQEEEVNNQRIKHVGCLDTERSFGDVDSKWETFLGFDPASGSKSRWSAYAAYVVLGYDKEDPDRRIYLIDYSKLQDNFDRMLDTLLLGNPLYGIEGYYEKYRYKIGTVEKNAFGKWMVSNDRVDPYVKKNIIQPHDTYKNKSDPEAGVFSMGEMVQNGRLRIPYATAADQEKAEMFIQDLLLYPKGTCDLVMALWLAQKPIRLQQTEYKSWFSKGGKGKFYENPAWA